MLSLNSISISSSDSKTLDEIYDILRTNSTNVDIANYHFHAGDNIKFLSLFFDGEDGKSYDSFGFDWAYIESCEKSDVVLADIYSYNGNLSIWTSELIRKYKMYKPIGFEIDISMEIKKSVKFKNYGIKSSIESNIPEIILNKKGNS